MEAAEKNKIVEKEISEKNITRKLRENPWMVSTFVFALVAIVLLVLTLGGGITGNVVSENDASDKLMTYLNELTGGGVEFVSAKDIGNLYEVTVSYQSKDIPVYITKDGGYLVNGVTALTGNVVNEQETGEETPAEIPKTDKPRVDLYVMSFCPYGNKAEDTLLPVYNLLKEGVDWNVHFIVSVANDKVSSLHGQPEVDEDEREACVLSEYGVAKWFSFATYVNKNCGSDGNCWETAARQSGLDVNKIKNCVTNKGLTLMKAEAAASDVAGVSGSPTLIINGVKSNMVYSYGDSDTYKQAVCSAFSTVPSECSEKLTSSTTTSTGGSC